MYVNGDEVVDYASGSNYTYDAANSINMTNSAPIRFGSNHTDTTSKNFDPPKYATLAHIKPTHGSRSKGALLLGINYNEEKLLNQTHFVRELTAE